MEIKANNWYRTRGGEIAFVFGINPYSPKERESVHGTLKEGWLISWFANGRYLRVPLADEDLVEHLPDCDGFDWVPTPKIKLEFNKKYVQTNGEIVGPITLLHSGEFCYYDIKLSRVWNESGIRLNDDKRATENIVAEYVEPTSVYEPWDFESMPVVVKVRNKDTGRLYVAYPAWDSVTVCDCGSWNYKTFLAQYEQLDNTPCGKRVQP